MNETQFDALDSIATGHPSGCHSTFRALRRRGLIVDSRGQQFRGQYALTSAGLELWKEWKNSLRRQLPNQGNKQP